MMRIHCPLLLFCLLTFTISCNSTGNAGDNQKNADSAMANAAAVPWKLGIALWTFHTADFPGSLAQVDSCGVKYIEANTFHNTGRELKDSLLGQLSPAGIDVLRSYISKAGLEASSLYLSGGNTVEAWAKDFERAKQLNVQFVTAEPPLQLWDAIDSLAGVYNLKVAIHDHWKGVSAYWHPDSVLAAIQNHPNFGACADVGHWPKSGINPVDGIKKLAGHIIALHLKDIAEFNNPKIEDVRAGTGVVDFPAIFKELKRQNFSGFVYIERDSQEVNSNVPSVIATVKYYNDEMKKLQ